jgi:hypothetical protein
MAKSCPVLPHAPASFHSTLPRRAVSHLESLWKLETSRRLPKIHGHRAGSAANGQKPTRGVTLVQVEMEYLPEPGSPTAQALGEKVDGDLAAFKRFVESQQKKELLDQTALKENSVNSFSL